MKIKTKIIFIFGTIFLAILLVSGVSIWSVNEITDVTDELYEHPFAVSNAARAIDGYILSIHRDMKDVAISKSQKNFAIYKSKIRTIEEHVLVDFKLIKEQFLGEIEKVKNLKMILLSGEKLDKRYFEVCAIRTAKRPLL